MSTFAPPRFCFDFAGCGESDGDYISLGWPLGRQISRSCWRLAAILLTLRSLRSPLQGLKEMISLTLYLGGIVSWMNQPTNAKVRPRSSTSAILGKSLPSDCRLLSNSAGLALQGIFLSPFRLVWLQQLGSLASQKPSKTGSIHANWGRFF